MIKTYSDKYKINDVMKLIGAQGVKPLLDGGLGDLKWVANAYGLRTVSDEMWDSFLLGTIYGKRMERLKRKSARG